MRIGGTLLEVSVPRKPCRAFAEWMGQKGWVRRFAARGDSGAYFRVIQPGVITRGDPIELVGRPDHDVTMGIAYAATMGDDELGRYVMEADVLPPMYQNRLVKRFRPRP